MSKWENVLSREYAQYLDQWDDLKEYRNDFYMLEEKIYFDGNSLGLLSKQAEQSLLSMVEAWKSYGIDGWTEGENPWYYFSEKLGELTAPLIGAEREEVIVTGSTTVNLHQLLSTFYKPEGKRTKILADELNFPSDIYAIKSQLELHHLNVDEHLILVKSRDGHTIREEDIVEAMSDEVMFAVLPSVLYRSGQILDMEYLVKEAHKRGIFVAFDLCHSIGAIPHELSKWGVDFAFWCTYKHLNGGPGSVGGLYVNKKHFSKKAGLAGWFGSDKRKQFDMELDLTPAPNAGSFQIGTPHLLSAAPLLGSLTMFHEATIEKVREKSLKLTEYLINLIEAELSEFGFLIKTPREDKRRGAHIFVEHKDAARICKALKMRNVIPDFRPPNGIRLSPVALYNTFEEVWQVVHILKEIMEKEEYKKFSNERNIVA